MAIREMFASVCARLLSKDRKFGRVDRPGLIREKVASVCARLLCNDEPVFSRVELRGLTNYLSEEELHALTEAFISNIHVRELSLNNSVDTRRNYAPPAALRSFVENVLSCHPTLKIVNLKGNNLTYIHAKWIGGAIKTNRALTTLTLDQNEIGSEGAHELAEGLRHNKTLKWLYLNRCNIGNDGFRAIASSLADCRLKVLWLGANYIGDDGATALAEGICKSTSLKTLGLARSIFGDAGCQAFATALGRTRTLCRLYLHFNKRITNAGGAALEAALEHTNYSLEELTIDRDGVTQDQHYRILRLCERNRENKRENDRRYKIAFAQWQKELPSISLALMPFVLERFESRPDLLYAILKAKPDALI